MFDLSGIPGLTAVYWHDLKPGMVYVGGVTINDIVPPELRNFPVLTPGLISALTDRYRFLQGRTVLVCPAGGAGPAPREISDSLSETAGQVDRLNRFRSSFHARRLELLGGAGRADGKAYTALPPETANTDLPALESDLVRRDSLILDHWASGLRVFDRPGNRPSLIGNLKAAVTISDVLSGTVWNKFRFPRTVPFELHIAVDASYSMKASGRDDIVQDTLAFMDGWLRPLLPEAEILYYGFSDECAPIIPPFTIFPVARGETRYESFVRKILHRHEKGKPATVLLFTDGVPTDMKAASAHLARFCRQGIDYTQVVFRIAEEGYGVVREGVKTLDGYRLDESDTAVPLGEVDQAAEAERVRGEFSELALTAGGNQIILTVDRALGVIAVEAFDRWLGAASVN